jgi:CHAT domain-containing protein/tetratricopeptide (TPR) repeat protein
MGCCERKPGPLPHRRTAWALLLLLAIPLHDMHMDDPGRAYDLAFQLFVHGQLRQCQAAAEQGIRRFQGRDGGAAARFRLLEARALLWRGRSGDALRVLAAYPPTPNDPGEAIEKLAVEGSALLGQGQGVAGEQRLTQALSLCKDRDYPVCGDAWRGMGNLHASQGKMAAAEHAYRQAAAVARHYGDGWREAAAMGNLGWVTLEQDRADDAVDLFASAYSIAENLNAEYLAEGIEGNLGLAYFELGDSSRALQTFRDAQRRAAGLGEERDRTRWLEDVGSIYQSQGDLEQALASYRQALLIARQNDSQEEAVIALEDIASAAVDAGKLQEAEAGIAQLLPLMHAGDDPIMRSDLLLAQGKLAAAQHRDRQAETLFRTLQDGAAVHAVDRLNAALELARLYRRQGRNTAAEAVYQRALNAFEAEREQLRSEESRLPYMANAMPLYDGYIRLLVEAGRGRQALLLAERSRARTLAQGLGLGAQQRSRSNAQLQPEPIAQATGATLFFYWLGEKESYLWAITPAKTTLFRLPPRDRVAALAEAYRQALLRRQYPLDGGEQTPSHQQGRQLYDWLVAPAVKLIPASGKVTILADGALSQLNFETLLAPGLGATSNHRPARVSLASYRRSPRPALFSQRSALSGRSLAPHPTAVSAGAEPGSHYWIEDATLLRAPSLSLLAAAKPASRPQGRLLILGDAVSPSRDYPELALAGMEMKLVERHFGPQARSAFARDRATPSAYLSGKPEEFGYIHFVTHGTASSVAPLDSAIVLSGEPALEPGGEPRFKLYAREIVQHPIDARLVTVSACYGSGARTYAGEGLIGLAWAFLRAGAHNVIGALWEVSDESSPRLMDSLYSGLGQGLEPAAALRAAKLSLLRAPGRGRAPFYWASFETYTGH